MAVSEEFQLRPLYEDLFYRYYRLATHADEGEKMSAGELYLSLRKKSGMKLPQSKISYFTELLSFYCSSHNKFESCTIKSSIT